jgi:Synergist-CTERM protein sorting domain-containing protein
LSVDVAIASGDPLVLGLSMDWNSSYQAFLRAHTSGKVSVDKKTYNVSKDNWRGKPVVSLAESGDLVKLSIYSPDLFFSSNDVVIAKVAAPVSSGSSSGCNVGFAPMALLLGLPLFFLKK